MTLEDAVCEAVDEGRKIVIVEPRSYPYGRLIGAGRKIVENPVFDILAYEKKRDDFARELGTFIGQEVCIETRTLEEIQGSHGDDLGINGALLLYSPEQKNMIPLLTDWVEAAVTFNALKAKYPESECYTLFRLLDGRAMGGELGGAVTRALKQALGLFDLGDFVERVHPIAEAETVVEGLDARLKAIAHRVGSYRDARFFAELSEKFMEGNLQTSIEQTFLVFNDQLKNREENKGKFHVYNQDASLHEIGFDDYLAVFIDNNWSQEKNPQGLIGHGIHLLQKLVPVLREKGVKIPIIYQTAHTLEELNPEEIARIESHPHTYLMPKNCAPKVSRSKKIALKELVTGELCREDERLARYSVEPVMIGKDGYLKIRDRFVTFTKAAKIPSEKDDFKAGLFQGIGIEDDELNHKMYVLSLFHTLLKGQIHNPCLQLVGKDYFPFDEIQGKIACEGPAFVERVDGLQSMYEGIIAQHRAFEPRVLTHNDAKWDNWFYGKILGDFGSVCPGTEYKDVARTLLSGKDDSFAATLIHDTVDGAIASYCRIRGALDAGFHDEVDAFKRRVYEMLVTESLRIASYKAGVDTAMTDGLLRVAEHYGRFGRRVLA